MVDPQLSSVSQGIRDAFEEQDVRTLAVLGGVGALGVVGVREAIDRLDGRAGISADPTTAQQHAINGVAKLLIGALLILGLSRAGMGSQAMAFGAVFAFGVLVSAGGNLIDAIGRARLQEAIGSQQQVTSSSSSRTRNRQRAVASNGAGGTRRGVSA